MGAGVVHAEVALVQPAGHCLQLAVESTGRAWTQGTVRHRWVSEHVGIVSRCVGSCSHPRSPLRSVHQDRVNFILERTVLAERWESGLWRQSHDVPPHAAGSTQNRNAYDL